MRTEAMGAPNGRRISVVMPAFRAARLLHRSLEPLLAMQRAGEIEEIIVVDDRSPDDTAEVARSLGARVVVAERNGGPGAARNLAAELAKGDILWFVDSDVVVWPGGPAILREAFAEPGIRAAFGSYDAAPDGAPWFSRYKNLMHRFYHQTGRRDAATFWAGCGAVDRAFFLALGGFDVETYRVPSIEDIELGYRIRRAGGRILLLPELQAKHLKVWTMRNGIFTDIFRRALPWSRLMIAREGLTDDLNTGPGERRKALVAGLLLVAFLGLPFYWVAWPAAGLLAGSALMLNWRFALFLRENGGTAFAAKGLIFHQVYYIYAAATFAWSLFEYHALRRHGRLRVP